MADASPPLLQECTTCGSLLDVTDEQPLSLQHCPTCGGAMRVRRHFNHFEIQEVLGAGGVGAVYRALDLTLGRSVALKLLRHEHSRSPELIASFAREAAITASINHPHVVKVYATGTDHGTFYIAMELVDKGSLDDLMALQGTIGEAQLLEVGIQVAQGLNAAHERGLIHRDVKPGNILFSDAHNAKIVDFGLAVLQEHANKEGEAIWGTPYYVAPEKLDSPPREDFRSDMYSLGATLFHAAAGRPPFEAETASMVQLKHLKSQAVSLQSFAPDISSGTAYVINRMLQRAPERRYASYAELIQNLQYTRNELLASLATTRRAGPRRAASTGWITFATTVAVVAGGLYYQHRDQLFRASRENATPVAKVVAPTLDPLEKARAQIAAGEYSAAAAALRELDAQPPHTQPRQNWITLNAALARLLAGESAEAQVELAKIESRGPYSPDPIEKKLADFFLENARLAASDQPIPAAKAKDCDGSTFECFAPLLLGVKDWSLGAFDDADALFRQFLTAAPEGAHAWIAAYQPIAANLSADLDVTRQLAKAAPHDIPALEKSLESVKAIRARQKTPGKFADSLAALEARFAAQLATATAAKAAKDAAVESAESHALADVVQHVTAAYSAFKFRDAALLLGAAHFTGEARQAERDAWLKRTEWLVRFKATLVSDINTTGYAQPLLRRNGTAIPNGLRKASDALAEMVTPYGNVPVPWGEVSIDSLATVAQAFIRTAPPGTAPDRQWQLGVFLYAFGKKAEGLALLRVAAEAKADYQAFLPLFPET
jgi:hypothetical protein